MSDFDFPDRRFLSPAPPSEPLIGGEPLGDTAEPERCLPALRTHSPRRTPHDGRSARLPVGTDAEAARQFAEQTLRMVFEVLEHRRPPDQLRGRMEPRVLDMVRTRTSMGGYRPSALTGPVRVQLIRRGSAEFFTRYATGARVGAVAGHLIRRRGGWRIDALRIG